MHSLSIVETSDGVVISRLTNDRTITARPSVRLIAWTACRERTHTHTHTVTDNYLSREGYISRREATFIRDLRVMLRDTESPPTYSLAKITFGAVRNYYIRSS